MKKVLLYFAAAVMALSLCSCSDLKLTPEMQEGIDAYLAAVRTAGEKTSGKVTVTTATDDDAIEFKKSESVIEFDYEVKDGTVLFSRTDTLDGQINARYESDGKTVYSLQGEKTDVTDQFRGFLDPAADPLITLSFFRTDSNYKVRTDTLKNVEYDGKTVVFTLKDSVVTTVLGYNKVKGIVRNSAGQTRTYFLNDGELYKIVIDSRFKVFNNGKEGVYSSVITVELD